MTDHERGAYTPPTDGGLTFDARQPVRGGGPAPMTLILSVVALAAVVAALFFFYRSGVRQAGQAPQPVGAPVTEMKSAPPPEAQPADPAAGLQIYRSEAGPTPENPPNFVPPPESPAPRAAPTAPVVVTQAPPPAIKPALPAETLAPKAMAAAPAPPKPEPVKAAPPKPAPVKAAPAKTEPVKAEATKPAAGGAVVQIGAVTTTALANKAWSDAVAAAPGLAAGKGKSITKIDKDGATLYRTAVTGFASRDAAQAFCNKLKAAGKSCFVR